MLSSCLAHDFGVTKFIFATDIILVTLCCATKVQLRCSAKAPALSVNSHLDVQQTHIRGRYVEQKLMLSSNFRCDQIHNCHWYDFGHTVVLLKSDLDVQQTHLRGLFI